PPPAGRPSSPQSPPPSAGEGRTRSEDRPNSIRFSTTSSAFTPPGFPPPAPPTPAAQLPPEPGDPLPLLLPQRRQPLVRLQRLRQRTLQAHERIRFGEGTASSHEPQQTPVYTGNHARLAPGVSRAGRRTPSRAPGTRLPTTYTAGDPRAVTEMLSTDCAS